jgi:hypothetical protein
MKFDNLIPSNLLGLTIFLLIVLFIVLFGIGYLILYFYKQFKSASVNNFKDIRDERTPYGQGWINLGTDHRITGEELYEMENSVLQINNNSLMTSGDEIVNSPIDTTYGMNKNIENKKQNALLNLNMCYLDLDNDTLNRTIMKPGSLPVLP